MGGGESKPEDPVIDDVNLDDDDDGEPTIEKLQKKLDLLKQDCVIEKKLSLFITMLRLYGDKHNIKDVGKVTEGINEIIELFKICLNNPKSIFYLDEETIDDLSFAKYLKQIMKGIIPLLVIIPHKENINRDIRSDPYAKKEKTDKLNKIIKKYVERVEAFDDQNLLNYVYDHSQEFPEVFRTIREIFNVFDDNNRIIFKKIDGEVMKDLNEVLEGGEVQKKVKKVGGKVKKVGGKVKKVGGKVKKVGGKVNNLLDLIQRMEKTENDFFEKMITEENSEKNGVLSILDNRDLVEMDRSYENDKKKYVDKLVDDMVDMLDRGGDGIIDLYNLKIEMGGKIEVSPKLKEIIKIFYENGLLLRYKERLRKRWFEYYDNLKKSGSKEDSPESSPVMEGMQNFLNMQGKKMTPGDKMVQKKIDTINECLGGCTENHPLRRLIKKETEFIRISPGDGRGSGVRVKKIKELKEKIQDECSDKCSKMAKDTMITVGDGDDTALKQIDESVARNLVALQQIKNPTQEEPNMVSWRKNREFGSLIKGDLGHKHLFYIDKEIEMQMMDNFSINRDIQQIINGLQEGFIGSIYRGQRNPLVVFCVFAFILILSILLISKIESILK